MTKKYEFHLFGIKEADIFADELIKLGIALSNPQVTVEHIDKLCLDMGYHVEIKLHQENENG